MTSPPDVLLGSQRPRILHVPPRASSAGREAVELAAGAGLVLDPWQEFFLDQALSESVPGERWSAFEVGLVVARQNGKGAILEARELAGLFLLGEQLIIHSAHEFKTAQEGFRRILQLIESTPDLDRRVMKVTRSHGDEGIELKTGQRLRFVARTGGSGRGFTGDCVILDEAFNLPEAALGALMPTMSARPNPQIWYTSSAVDQTVHPHGVVLARVRERGIAGTDPSLVYGEWSVDESVYWADPEGVATDVAAVAQANPGLGIRITAEHVGREQRSMDPRTFGAERLGVGDWPSTGDDDWQVVDRATWESLVDTSSKAEDPVAFAFDVTPDRRQSAIGVAGRRPDGRRHVEVVEHRAGTRWVVPRLVELVERWRPCVVLVDGRSPAASLIPELEEAGLKVASGEPQGDALLWRSTAGDMAQACGAFFDAATNDELRHMGDSALSRALAVAQKRDLGDAWAWARKLGGDISPLVAVTLANHGQAVWGGRTIDVAQNVW